MTTQKPTVRRRTHGFSLLELTVALAIFGTVAAIAMTASKQLINTNSTVTSNVDLVQQGRQFMDQISSDLHMAGYPNYKMFDQSQSPASTSFAGTYSSTNTTTNSNAAGLIAATQNSITFEGDVDNSGTVSVEVIQLCVGTNPGNNCVAPTASSQCPCTMQRGTMTKTTSTTATPAFYTELSGVMNWNVFTFFQYDGTTVAFPLTTTSLINVRAVRIQLQVQSTRKDAQSGLYQIATLDSEAKLSN